MNHKTMSEHLAKLPHQLNLPEGWSHSAFEWPYPNQCCTPESKHSDPGHEEHEIKGHDAAHAEITKADGSKDFVKISGEFVRNSTPEEIAAVLAVQTFGEESK
jgi:hypothetical protein